MGLRSLFAYALKKKPDKLRLRRRPLDMTYYLPVFLAFPNYSDQGLCMTVDGVVAVSVTRCCFPWWGC